MVIVDSARLGPADRSLAGNTTAADDARADDRGADDRGATAAASTGHAAVLPANADGRASWRLRPSYPDVCIPSLPPDLDCGDVSHRRFTVIGNDPHGFDGDHDGIGCESS